MVQKREGQKCAVFWKFTLYIYCAEMFPQISLVLIDVYKQHFKSRMMGGMTFQELLSSHNWGIKVSRGKDYSRGHFFPGGLFEGFERRNFWGQRRILGPGIFPGPKKKG